MGDDTRIASILGRWQSQLDRGEDVDPEAVIAQHPDLADDLREQFKALSQLRQAHAAKQSPTRLRTLPLDRYGEFKPAGEGGMGIVYWAIDTDLNREVAFKVIRPASDGSTETPAAPLELSSPAKDTPASKSFETLKQRFLQEAWVTGGLSHPGIVPVYELGQTPEGVPYYTMRFIKGERTLATAIEEAKEADVEQRLRLLEPFLKVCDTLSYAHAKGVIHRDLKPDNIALGEFGEVVVIDWGLARIRDCPDVASERWQDRIRAWREAKDLRTVAGAIGTPGYMPPESVKGNPNLVDARGDIYALGVILFQILTGRMPFEFTSLNQYLGRLLDEEPLRATDVSEDVPGALSDLCARCLSAGADERPPSADALAAEIRDWQAQSAVEREIDGFLQEARVALDAAKDLGGAAMLQQIDQATAALSQVRTRRPQSARSDALQARADALRETGVRERERAARKRVVVRGGIAVLVAAVIAGVLGSIVFRKQRDEADAARASEAQQRERADQEARAARTNLARAYAHLATTLLRDGRAGEARVAAAQAMVMEPTLEGAGAVGMLSTSWSPTVRMLVPGTSALPLAMAPKGRRLFSGGTWDRSIRIWDLEQDRAVGFLRGHEDTVLALAPSVDGSALYSGGTGGAIHVWDVKKRSLTGTLPTRGSAITALAVGPASGLLWSGCEDGSVHAWEPDTGNHRITIETRRSRVIHIGTAASAERILVQTADGKTLLYGTTSGYLVATHDDTTIDFLSPDGISLYRNTRRGRYERLDHPPRRSETPPPTMHRIESGTLAITPDGRRAVFPYDSFFWSRNPGQLRRIGFPGRVQALATTPDGTRAYASLFDTADRSSNGSRTALLATGSIPGTGDPVDVTNVSAYYDAHPGDVQAVAITADGTQLVSAGDDGGVIWWDLASGLPTRWVKGFRDKRYMSSILSHDGTMLVTGSSEGEIHVRSLDEEAKAWSFEGHVNTVSALALCESKPLLAMGGWGGVVKVWRLREQEEEPEKVFEAWGRNAGDLDSNVSAVALDAAGEHVYGGTWSGRIDVWDVESGALVRSLEGHVGMIYALEVSPDGKRLYSASNDFTVRIWDLEADEDPLVLRGHEGTYGVTCVEVSPDGRELYSGGNDGTIRRWDAVTGDGLGVLTSHRDAVYCLALSRDGGRLYSGGGKGAASDLMGDCLIREWRVDARAAEDYCGVVGRRTFALSKDGRHAVLWPSGEPLTVAVLDPATGTLRAVPELQVDGPGGGITTLSPKGDRVYYVDGPDAIAAWSLTPDATERRFVLGRSGTDISALGISPEGDRVIAGHGDGSVSVWDTETRRRVLGLRAGTAAVTAVAMQPGRARVYAGDEQANLYVWDAKTGELVKSYPAPEGRRVGDALGIGAGSGVEDIVLSPDGRRLYGAAGEVLVVDLENEVTLDPIQVRGCWINRVALSPHGRRLFAAGSANTYLLPGPGGGEDETPVLVWDVEQGELEAVLHGHGGEVDFLAASPDGRRVISSSWDRTTRVWDIPWAVASPHARLRQAEERYGHAIRGFGTVSLGVDDLIERRLGTFARDLVRAPRSDLRGEATRER